jgi:amino acid adenylation domain-containing protein
MAAQACIEDQRLYRETLGVRLAHKPGRPYANMFKSSWLSWAATALRGKDSSAILASEVTRLKGENSFYARRVAELEEHNRLLTEAATERAQRVQDQEGQLASLHTEIATLTPEVTRLKGENSFYARRVAELEEHNRLLTEAATERAQRVQDQEGQLAALHTEIATLTPEVTRLKGENSFYARRVVELEEHNRLLTEAAIARAKRVHDLERQLSTGSNRGSAEPLSTIRHGSSLGAHASPGGAGMIELRAAGSAAVTAAAAQYSIVEGFERAAAAHRSRPAILSNLWQPTYDELNHCANRLAHKLLACPGAAGGRVGILMDYDSPLLAALLAVLKAGRIAVPLRSADPVEQLRQVIAHVEPGLLVTDSSHRHLASEIAPANCDVMDFVDHATEGSADNPDVRLSADAVAVLAYSSGSTGLPNALMITHGQIIEDIGRVSRGLEIVPQDRIAHFAAVNTLSAIKSSMLALLSGATLCPFAVAQRGIGHLADWLSEQQITVYISGTSFFRNFVKTLPDGRQFPHMRVVRIGGESGTASDFAAFRKHFRPGSVFIHGYAASEVGSIAQLRLTHDDPVPKGRLSVGLPFEGLEVSIEDDEGKTVAPGEVGQIVVRGNALAAGYWRNPALTANRFGQGSIGRIFRGGDLGRFNDNGLLEYLGRTDSQVKVRGFRVMLTDVEDTVASMPGVEGAAVCAIEQPNETVRIVAYVVLNHDAPANPAPGQSPASLRDASISSLRREIRTILPDHMTPSEFVVVDRLPRTTTGKIDRQKLQQARPDDRRQVISSATPGANGEPRAKMREMLLTFWRAVLNRQDIGPDDDFFLCGGNSLAALDLFHRIENELHYQLPLTVLSEAPTVNLFAACLETAAAGLVSNMARVNAAGRQRPLFAIHGVHGHTLGLLSTLRALGPDQPVFGLQPPKMDWASVGCTTVQQVAAYFIGEIKAVQPQGPYRLLGTSFGGVVAFEMALQLQNSGDSAEYLALVDTNPPTCKLEDDVDLWLGHRPPNRQQAGPILDLHLRVYEQHVRMMSAYALDDRLKQGVFRGELTYFCCTGNPILAKHDRRRLWQHFASRFRLLLLASPHDVGTPGSDRTAFQDLLRASLNGEVQTGSDPAAVFNRTYQIEDRDGHEYILDSIGEAYRVEQNRMQGNIDGVFIEDETIQFKGWVVEPCGRRPAQTIAVFLDHRYLGCGATSERRPDVADKLAAHSALYAGFNFHFKRRAIPDVIGKPRVFVLSNGGSAAELTSAA